MRAPCTSPTTTPKIPDVDDPTGVVEVELLPNERHGGAYRKSRSTTNRLATHRASGPQPVKQTAQKHSPCGNLRLSVVASPAPTCISVPLNLSTHLGAICIDFRADASITVYSAGPMFCFAYILRKLALRGAG